MIFKQFRHERLAQASYLIGCATVKEAFVVDSIADLGADAYALEAADFGLTIVGVLETHIHADYISCARELAEMTGTPHYLHETAAVRYAFTQLRDGQVLPLGKVRIQVLHTPGHTPEHCCYLITDTTRAEEAWCVLTGDCLFVGDVGRPDLLIGEMAGGSEEERTIALFHSIQRLLGLPDHVEIYPNHYGGSRCGGVNMSGKVSSTIGFEKRFNLAAQQPDAHTFARFVRETARPYPVDYERIKSHNLGIPVEEVANARQ